MHIFKVKYFIFGEPVVAIVRADNKDEALEILESKCDKEDNFTLREIHQYEDNVKDVLLSVFT
jgi:hypothetical protein